MIACAELEDLAADHLQGSLPRPKRRELERHMRECRPCREFLAAYQALIDAVFTAPGAGEWLHELRQAMAAMLARQDGAPYNPVACDAIRAADRGLKRA